MYWETSLTTALWYTILVSVGAALAATTLGWLLAGLTSVWQVIGHRFLTALITSLVLLPLYVHATAWSAGFGSQGWFRWNQVVAVGSNSYAVLACVWIHSVAALPVTFLILRSGWVRSLDEEFSMAMLDRSFSVAVFGIAGRKVLPWCLLSFGLVFAWASSEMVVTNLFQVPTLTESLYQSVQFEKIRWAPYYFALGYAVAIGVVCCLVTRRYSGKITAEEWNIRLPVDPVDSTLRKGGLSLLAWALTCLTVGIPLLSMVAKAGGHVSMLDGVIVPTWSLQSMGKTFVGLRSFQNEFYWSVVLGLYSSITSVAIGGCLLVLARSNLALQGIAFVLGAAFAMPGPIINQSIQSLFQQDVHWLQELNQRTIVAPLLCIQFRTLPIVFAILWLADKRFQAKYQSLLLLDSNAWRVRLLAILGWSATATIIAFFVSFANLESYILVLPPQVTTLSLRLFELLHYGVQNREAGVGLAMTIVCVLTSLLLSKFHSSTIR